MKGDAFSTFILRRSSFLHHRHKSVWHFFFDEALQFKAICHKLIGHYEFCTRCTSLSNVIETSSTWLTPRVRTQVNLFLCKPIFQLWLFKLSKIVFSLSLSLLITFYWKVYLSTKSTRIGMHVLYVSISRLSYTNQFFGYCRSTFFAQLCVYINIDIPPHHY